MTIQSRTIKTALGAGLCMVAPLLAGCEFLVGLLTPRTTHVRLVNNSDFQVTVRIFVDDDQNVLSDLIDDQGTELTFILTPGEVENFTRDCDALQAIVVDNAELNVVGQIGPEAGTSVLRDGSDFSCGDRIIFTFDHSAILTDFRVSVSVTNP